MGGAGGPGRVRAFFGSLAGRPWLRTVAIAVLASLVATLLTTICRPEGDPVAAADDRFPLEVAPDLAHVEGQELTVTIGTEETTLTGDAARIDGTAGISGMVQVYDDDGHLAGSAVAPKDPEVLFGLADDDGPLDIPVTYESTAFSIFATQPGLATTEPAVTVMLAALVFDLPEFEALTDALATQAADDPGYLEDLAPAVRTAMGDLLAAFEKRAEEVEAELDGPSDDEDEQEEDEPDDPSAPPTTRLRMPASPGQTDPDGCSGERPANVIVVDVRNQDHVCLSRAEFDGSVWEISGSSSTPRWAMARAFNRSVPAEAAQLVPGKALQLPSLEALAFDLAHAIAEGLTNEAINKSISLCNGAASLIGKRCGEPNRPDLLQTLTTKAKSYFADATFAFEVPGSESQTVVSVAGFGTAGGEGSGDDIASSLFVTYIMTIIVPAIGLLIDRQDLNPRQEPVSHAARTAMFDTVASLAPEIATLPDRLEAGGLVDKLKVMVDFGLEAIRATVDSGLLIILLREFFIGAGISAAVNLLGNLARNIAKAPIKWIDLGLDAINGGVTLLMLIDDIPELSTSARYALGYEEAPPDPPTISDSPPGPILNDPVENPAMPTRSCGLRVALVLDRSSSIRDAGDEAMTQVRDAAVGLIDSLGTTPSSVRISAFGTWATTRIGWTSLADAEGRRATRQAANGVDFASGSDNSGSTNWEAALTDVLGQDADLAVLVTDGNPTSFGSGIESTSTGSGTADFDPAALAAGVDAANVLKKNGTRVVAVGVGDVNVDPLRQVSGPTEGSDYFLGEFDSLGTSLASVATELCGGGLVVRHLVDGIPTGGASYTFDVPGHDTETLVTAADGSTRLSLRESVDSVTVRGPTGLPLADITCDQGGQAVDAPVDEGERSVEVDLDGVVTCTFAWRALTGPDAALAEILQGPGRVEVLSFEPRPALGGAVVGCLGRSATRQPEATPTCNVGQFGVSWSAGFAVIRYDDTCSGCDLVLLDIASTDDGGVRFQLDESFRAGSGLGVGLGAVDLDLTVATRAPRLQPTLEGTMNGGMHLDVDLRQPPQADVCLARHRPSNLTFIPRNDTITTGTGC